VKPSVNTYGLSRTGARNFMSGRQSANNSAYN
jgi:hypothetical protein